MELTQTPSYVASESSRRHLEEARQAARENLAEARRLIWALHPKPLERYSLPEALERLLEEWSEQAGVETSTTIIGSRVSLRSEIEISIFRIAQESLANARKHAGASRVALTLSYAEDSVMLDVLDDGVGFDNAGADNQRKPGFGLIAMRERVEKLGGVFSVESAPGKGTTLRAKLSINPETEPDAGHPIRQESLR